jgi:GNAT superfamily N-acetyltransferase
VRLRSVADENGCLQLLRETHDADGYPARWPRNPWRFLAPPHEITAWVWAESDNVHGHIALHANDHLPAVDAACVEAGLSPDQVGLVARLLVAPTARRQGIATYLLAHAAAEANRLGLRPVLDVAKHHGAAVAFYEACRWTQTGDLTLNLADGVLECWFFVGPELST